MPAEHCFDQSELKGQIYVIFIIAVLGFVQVLSEEDAERVNAAVKGIEAFVDTLMLVTETQQKLSRQSSAEEAAPPNEDAPAEPTSVEDAPSVEVLQPHNKFLPM